MCNIVRASQMSDASEHGKIDSVSYGSKKRRLVVLHAEHDNCVPQPVARHASCEPRSKGDAQRRYISELASDYMCARVRACGDSRPLLAALHYPNLSYAAPSYIALCCPALSCIYVYMYNMRHVSNLGYCTVVAEYLPLRRGRPVGPGR